jgi:hypothetical protein
MEAPRPRAVGSPLSAGGSGRPVAVPAPAEVEGPRVLPAAAEPALPVDDTPEEEEMAAADPASHGDSPSGLQRAVNGLRAAWPFVQKILPLLDGQVVTAVANVLAPSRPPAPAVNLTPLRDGLEELHNRQLELREQVAGQNAALKRVEDRLESVREATDRNTLEQQELMEELKTVGRKANWIAAVALLLLAASVGINVWLFLHIRHVLP